MTVEEHKFKDLGLDLKIISAIEALGYEAPSSIQAKSIPVLLSGKDLLAQAQTGTGKTAAFALPVIQNINLKSTRTQALVLTPTRELALQVAESLQSYARNYKDFHVLAIYGGQDFRPQLQALKRGVQVVVGTPGRVMDHLRRGTLSLDALSVLVLDEADEMLKMGFKEDVEWILEHTPGSHQTALFSATLPSAITRVASKYLKDPTTIQIKASVNTQIYIDQSFMVVARHHKLEALTRYLEVEDTDGMIIFSRTKTSTVELAQKLEARGYRCAGLNGDMNQAQRERVIQQIKKNQLDVIVATDVAARGIDVSRISHVINYDIPYDPESYVHRIGRTGRAGRHGKSLLLVAPREQRMLKDIQRITQVQIKQMAPPSAHDVTKKRSEALIESVKSVLEAHKLKAYRKWVDQLSTEDHDLADVAAALAYLVQKNKPLMINDDGRLEASFEFSGGGARRGGSGGSSSSRGRFNSRSKDSRSDNRPLGGARRGYEGRKGTSNASESPSYDRKSTRKRHKD